VKTLLINPSFESVLDIGLSYSEPLGLAYIAAAIEKSGNHYVDILDGVGLATGFQKRGEKIGIGLSDDRLLSMISERTFDVIGVSVISSFYAAEILRFIGKLKNRFPNVPIIIGGAHATFEWESCMATGRVDYIVLGEGEGTINELLDAIAGSVDIRKVKGVVFRDHNGVATRNEPRKALPIDGIPWPARHLIPMQNYFRLRPRQYLIRIPAASIFTSRACPYSCVFCSTRRFWGRNWRGRKPADVVDEMQHLCQAYGVREFLIQDDNFLANPKRVEGICDEIIKRRLDIRWQIPPGVSVWLLTPSLLEKMHGAGLYIIRPQIETGNPTTLTYINKPIDLEHARKIIRYANRLGIWTHTNFIIGFYFESREDIDRTVRFAESLGVDNLNYYIAVPYRHTPMYDDYLQAGLIEPDQPPKTACDIEHFTAREIVRIRDQAQARYLKVRLRQLLDPRVLINEMMPKINSAEKLAFLFRRLRARTATD